MLLVQESLHNELVSLDTVFLEHVDIISIKQYSLSAQESLRLNSYRAISRTMCNDARSLKGK